MCDITVEFVKEYSAGFEEHWWHKDYGNVRIIGLNSNNPFATDGQLEWLNAVLSETYAADSIDFVFAQLHHPHKSELWIPGESDFTGEVIDRLEQFTSNCNKPSIHFFGHTHGYSRGQSRDHKHLWVNAASAGGAIDNWGEFANFDYDEFSVSQDEYGFVVMEITNDDDPKFVLKRISRGDQDVVINNQLTDSLTIRLNPSIVNQPEAISPIANVEIAPECATLKGGDFSSPNANAVHGQSHWQLTTLQSGFDNPITESWKNFENWYFEVDTQLGDDLRDESIVGLDEFTDYLWRVRYRDREMNWSEWSETASFTTGASIGLPNLLVNPGAENDLDAWTITQGVAEALEGGVCDGTFPNRGEKYFAVGGLCNHSETGRLVQDIDVSAYMDSIDLGGFQVSFGGYLSDFANDDLPEVKLIFLDENSMELGQSSTLSTLNSSWTLLKDSLIIPQETRTIRMELKGTRNIGVDNDSYFDDLFLSVGTAPDRNCEAIVPIVGVRSFDIGDLKISPNPAQDYAKIELPEILSEDFYVVLTNSEGVKVNPPYQKVENALTVNTSNLPKGLYVVWLRGKLGVIYRGKLIIVD